MDKMANKIYKDIEELKKELQPLVKSFLEKAKVGVWHAELTETYRTQERQLELYKAGKTPAKVATYHNWRLAFDIAMFKNGRKQVSWDFKLYAKVAPIAEKMGFTWGGRWKVRDGCHFQWEKPLPKPAPKPAPKPDPDPCAKVKEQLASERRVVNARDEELRKLRIERDHFADRTETAEKELEEEKKGNEAVEAQMAGTLVLRTARIEELELLVRSLAGDAELGQGIRIIWEAIKNTCKAILAKIKEVFKRDKNN